MARENDAPAHGSTEPAELASVAIRGTGPAWFPGLARVLARHKWEQLGHDFGLGPDTYGTIRVVAGSSSGERNLVATVPLQPSFGRDLPVPVEVLHGARAREYEELGLRLAEPAFAGSTGVRGRLASAFDVLGADPTLADTLGALLGVLHVASVEGPDYDVSYSDPRLPFSVFVGMHPQAGEHADLRLAEGILHECMHLQLTLIEELVPLISGCHARHYSPWQMTMRPAQGVLHGTYVFSVIRDVLVTMVDCGGVSPADVGYVADRIGVCRGEIAQASADLLSGDGLTMAGRALVSRLAAEHGAGP